MRYTLSQQQKWVQRYIQDSCEESTCPPQRYSPYPPGPKRRLIRRRFTALSRNCLKIQTLFRGWSGRKFIASYLEHHDSRSKYQNNTTFCGLELDQIPPQYFVKYTKMERDDNDDRNFAFDLRELAKLREQSKKELRNPYTQIVFSAAFIHNVERVERYLYQLDRWKEIDNEIPRDSRLTVRCVEVFAKLEELRTYPDLNRFCQLAPEELLDYVYYLEQYPSIAPYLNNWYYMSRLRRLAHDRPDQGQQEKRRKMMLLTLDLIEDLLDIRDSFQTTRALIISQGLLPEELSDSDEYGEDL